MKARFKHSGETIIEILAAMTVLTLIITSTYTILLRAMKTNTSVKNRVIALNIAREGLEGVRNIRDTNWLRYSGDRRNKWLCRDAYYQFGANHTKGDCSSAPAAPYTLTNPIPSAMLHQVYKIKTGICSAQIDSGYYILERVASSGVYDSFGDASCNVGSVGPYYILEPRLPSTASAADLENNRESFRLYYDKTTDKNVRHASHKNESCTSLPCSPTEPYTPTPFYRSIKIETVSPFEDPDGGPDLDTTPVLCTGNCDTAKVKITSIVEWEEGEGNWEKVKLEGHLFDFYERTDY